MAGSPLHRYTAAPVSVLRPFGSPIPLLSQISVALLPSRVVPSVQLPRSPASASSQPHSAQARQLTYIGKGAWRTPVRTLLSVVSLPACSRGFGKGCSTGPLLVGVCLAEKLAMPNAPEHGNLPRRPRASPPRHVRPSTSPVPAAVDKPCTACSGSVTQATRLLLA